MDIIKTISNPGRIILSLGNHGLIKWMPDKMFLSIAYRTKIGRKLDWNNLLTFNQKLQWLKLYDRNPDYTTFVDKYEVRKVVADKVGDKYLIPLYGVWDNWEEINFTDMPNSFVLKCTHDGGSVVICKNKNEFDFDHAKSIIQKALKRNFFWHAREWPYKNVKPRVIAEEFLENDDGSEVVDYKLQCFDGKFDNALICINRFSKDGVKYCYFDKDWNLLPYSKHVFNSLDFENVKPIKFEEMITLAEKLSEGIPEIRVDFYEVNGQIYFGELTFFSAGGCDTTITEEADCILGKKLLLPNDAK